MLGDGDTKYVTINTYIEHSNFDAFYESRHLKYPTKINSLSLDKTPNFKGVLMGIKGQYLIFEDGTVFNIRGSEGYVVSLDV